MEPKAALPTWYLGAYQKEFLLNVDFRSGVGSHIGIFHKKAGDFGVYIFRILSWVLKFPPPFNRGYPPADGKLKHQFLMCVLYIRGRTMLRAMWLETGATATEFRLNLFLGQSFRKAPDLVFGNTCFSQAKTTRPSGIKNSPYLYVYRKTAHKDHTFRL